MTEFHRKIELQSPDDLQYLISNVRRAANEKIDKDLPPIEGEDKMRTRVEELVQNYINTVFQTTAANITINGMTPSPEMLSSILDNTTATTSIEEHEPFNTKLFDRAKDLSRKEEDLIEEIAALRRKMPSVAVDNAKATYQAGLESDEVALRGWEEGVKEHGADLGIGKLERQDAVEGNWMKGVHGLERLKRSMPESVAKKERAERAENYVVARERK